MRAHRAVAIIAAALLLAGISVPVAASAWPGGPTAQRNLSPRADHTVVLREPVHGAGIYAVRVTVSTSSLRRSLVSVRIGHLARRGTAERARRVSFRVRLSIRRHAFMIRAVSSGARPDLHVSVHKLQSLPSNTPPKKQPPPTKNEPSTKSRTGSASPGGPTGPTGSTGGDPATPAAPASPAPQGTTNSGIYAGPQFAPTANYTTAAEDWEFNGSSLPAPWQAGTSNYGYSATQYQPSQVTMTGSSAALTAISQTSPQGFPYTSGWISTSGAYSFHYGMVDFRAKMPAGQGLWSGLWMVNPQGTSPNTEIDVQEMLLGDTHTIYGSLHNWGPTPYWAETQQTTSGDDLSAGFHDFQLIWQPGMLTWAVDGVAYAQYTEAQATAAGQGWPFDATNGVYLIANLAVGSANDWGGAPNASTVFPATMQIQSIKIWQ
ncbi:MAG TPA: glycoside hydrolase family 16 protein [Solirubrobacteraceae bacterium]|nr:glycoside hydrolase family 16 protein [Solirubrobacteraceae bacterium]